MLTHLHSHSHTMPSHATHSHVHARAHAHTCKQAHVDASACTHKRTNAQVCTSESVFARAHKDAHEYKCTSSCPYIFPLSKDLLTRSSSHRSSIQSMQSAVCCMGVRSMHALSSFILLISLSHMIDIDEGTRYALTAYIHAMHVHWHGWMQERFLPISAQ